MILDKFDNISIELNSNHITSRIIKLSILIFKHLFNKLITKGIFLRKLYLFIYYNNI